MQCSLHHTITSHTSDITAVTFTHNTLASSSSDKTVRFWQVDNGYRETNSSPLCGHQYSVHCCVFSPCGKILASCSTDGRCVLWVVTSGQKLTSLQHPSGSSLRSCCFSPDGKRLATGGDDEKMCLWDTSSYQLIQMLEGPEASIVALVFSPHSEFLIAGSSGGDVRVWDALYGHGRRLAMQHEAHDLGVTCVAVSPNYGSAEAHQVHYLLASGGFDNMLKLWDILATPGSPIEFVLRAALAGHTGPVMGCSFSLAHRLVASVGADKTLRIWDPVSGELLITLNLLYVTCCAFSQDGSLLATGSNDKQIHVWSLRADRSLQEKQKLKTRHKDPKEWSIHEVSDWLLTIGLPQYVTSFIENAIDGVELLSLKDETLLNALGVTALGHRNKILRAAQSLIEKPAAIDDDGAPDEYLCPITRELMTDPVMASDGYTYEREAIISWINSGQSNSPMTNAPLLTSDLTPNRSLKMLVSRFIQENA
ncbi:hypothetical protein CAPTEDRAFT_93086 [Capitella teleta]|uniref:WD repeat, SAM and U-box domain-containing protein 1 n=1 Tax=Capitella teleta TaxID=283909 RepID=X2BBV4_CAPTE|nr:hypothetical protein CAPTEDRAFT_93086 [Capitella teleta]|eukprot:ELU10109.1 hypothetical protein CAPTEDRAFT_93086 [Capitella teleta]